MIAVPIILLLALGAAAVGVGVAGRSHRVASAARRRVPVAPAHHVRAVVPTPNTPVPAPREIDGAQDSELNASFLRGAGEGAAVGALLGPIGSFIGAGIGAFIEGIASALGPTKAERFRNALESSVEASSGQELDSRWLDLVTLKLMLSSALPNLIAIHDDGRIAVAWGVPEASPGPAGPWADRFFSLAVHGNTDRAPRGAALIEPHARQGHGPYRGQTETPYLNGAEYRWSQNITLGPGWHRRPNEEAINRAVDRLAQFLGVIP